MFPPTPFFISNYNWKCVSNNELCVDSKHYKKNKKSPFFHEKAWISKSCASVFPFTVTEMLQPENPVSSERVFPHISLIPPELDLVLWYEVLLEHVFKMWTSKFSQLFCYSLFANRIWDSQLRGSMSSVSFQNAPLMPMDQPLTVKFSKQSSIS